MTKKGVMMGGLAAFALVTAASGPANAQSMHFGGGPMKNLYIDLIFWGDFCNKAYCDDRQDVLDYVTDLASYLRGVGAPVGMEPALHYYGVSDITVGTWVAGTSDLFGYAAGQAQPGLDEMSGMVAAARAGAYGPAYDFYGNYYGSALPTGSNRLPIVISLGANTFDDYGTCQGFHDSSNGNPYAAVQWESRAVISHEIFEAMTDPTLSAPVIFTGPGWSGSNNFFVEVADQCESNWSYDGNWTVASTYQQTQDNALNWRGTIQPNNDDISGLASITVNAPYNSPYPYPQVSCEFFIPEQHAPMTATFEYGGNGTQPLVLYYREPNGHLASVEWGNAGYSASAPYDIGQPSPTVTAVGKPSVVYGMYVGGEFVFTKGSDAALWMHYNGKWTSLGGLLYGDPSATVWDNGQLIAVLGLGTDDHLYYYILTASTFYGWNGVPNPNGTAFVGSPTVISRSATGFDVFAIGENGQNQWISYSSSTGWSESRVTNLGDTAMTATPSVVAQKSTNVMDVFSTDGFNMWDSTFNNASWTNGDARFQLPYPETNYGLQGTPAAVSMQAGRSDVFAVSRYGELWWWDSTTPSIWVNGTGANRPLVASGVSGDPVVVSRGPNEMEVFYRMTYGTLAHLTYQNGVWLTPEYVLSTYAIQ